MATMIGSWLLVVALVIGLGVWLVRSRDRVDANESARRILAERYARGEVDTDEYASRLAGLR